MKPTVSKDKAILEGLSDFEHTGNQALYWTIFLFLGLKAKAQETAQWYRDKEHWPLLPWEYFLNDAWRDVTDWDVDSPFPRYILVAVPEGETNA